MKRDFVCGEWFCGNRISEYGLKNGYVDYATLAKAFDAVLNNSLMENTSNIGYWEPIQGGEYYEDDEGNIYSYDEAQEKIEELQAVLDSLEEDAEDEAQEAIQEKIDSLEDCHYPEVYQWYIISDYGASILQDYTDEVLYYNDKLDIWLWGITHYGTSWSYVLTNIRCNAKEEE